MKRSKIKACKKSTPHSTFSMIKFYESIPSKSSVRTSEYFSQANDISASNIISDYEEIGHLPDFDFTQRVHLLRKVHCDLSKSSMPKTSSTKRPKSRCKKKKCVKAKSASRKMCNGTPSTCEVGFFLAFCSVEFIQYSNIIWFAESQKPIDY